MRSGPWPQELITTVEVYRITLESALKEGRDMAYERFRMMEAFNVKNAARAAQPKER